MGDDIDFDFFDSPDRTTPPEKAEFDVQTEIISNDKLKLNLQVQLKRNDNHGDDHSDREMENSSSRKHLYEDSNDSSTGTGKKKLLVKASIPSVSLDEHSDHSFSSDDGKNDFFNFALSVNEQESSINHQHKSSSRNRKKPPLPLPRSTKRPEQHENSHSTNCNRNNRHPHKDSIISNPVGLNSRSTYSTSDDRKVRKTRNRHSDEELSDSASSSEEEVRFHRRRGERKKSKLKINVDNLSPRENESSGSSHRSRHRSRSISPHWSSGSEDGGRDDGIEEPAYRPSTRLTHRRSSSSGSSISVSSLSDTEGPESSSRAITSAHVQKTRFADSPDKDRLNLELLLAALLEDDEAKASSDRKHHLAGKPQPSQRSANSRSNYTFTSDRAKMIDLENQRLLNNIIVQRAGRAHPDGRPTSASTSSASQKSKAKVKATTSSPVRVTAFSVNRLREQQRIERENLSLLRRLNKVKPSSDVSRTQALTDYNRQMAYYCPELRAGTGCGDMSAQRSRSSLSTAGSHGGKKPRPASAGYGNRPVSAGYGNRPSSAYTSLSNRSTRPTSATNRPPSATNRRPASAGRVVTTSTKPRPEWQSGW